MPREPAAERLAPPLPQHVWEYSFPDRERNRYVSRSLGYVVLLNGAAALTLMAIVALNPESTSHRLAWAMLVFASGAMAGLLSSLFAYVRRLFAVSLPTHIFMRDFLRVSAIVMAVGGRGFPDRDEHCVTTGARGLDYAHEKQAGREFQAAESSSLSNRRARSNIAKGASL